MGYCELEQIQRILFICLIYIIYILCVHFGQTNYEFKTIMRAYVCFIQLIQKYTFLFVNLDPCKFNCTLLVVKFVITYFFLSFVFLVKNTKDILAYLATTLCLLTPFKSADRFLSSLFWFTSITFLTLKQRKSKLNKNTLFYKCNHGKK